MLRWLYLDLNSFFASCEQQEVPALRGKPIGVVAVMADTTSCIAASYEAKAFGVKTGTKVADAKKMCPGIQFVEARHPVYIRYHHLIHDVLESCIPIHSVCSIDEFACELTGSQQQEAVAVALAGKIKQRVREQVGECVTSSIGIAPNMLLAKIASDMKKPDGLTVIRQEELPDCLKVLKTRDIPGIGAKMEQRLLQRGVRTMEQLLSLSEQQMHVLWGGILGNRYYRLLRGEQIMVSRQRQQSFSHEHVLPPELRQWQGSFEVAQKLLSKVAIRMRKENLLTRRLQLGVRFMDSEEKFHRDRKFQETQDTSLLISYLREFFQQIPKKRKPYKVTVVLSDFCPKGQHQFSFFENTKREEIFSVVDKLNEKFGKNTVMLACLKDHQETAPTRIAFQRIPELEE